VSETRVVSDCMSELQQARGFIAKEEVKKKRKKGKKKGRNKNK